MNPAVSQWLSENEAKFKPQQVLHIRSKLEEMNDTQTAAIMSVPLKNPTTMLIINLFLGGLGVHRFILGDAGKGILCWFTCGIMSVIDLFSITDMTRDFNYNKILPYLL